MCRGFAFLVYDVEDRTQFTAQFDVEAITIWERCDDDAVDHRLYKADCLRGAHIPTVRRGNVLLMDCGLDKKSRCICCGRKVLPYAHCAYSILMGSEAVTQSGHLRLPPSECEFIDTYNRENENYDFVSDFVYMAHTAESSGGGCRDCQRPLSKRQLDIEMSLIPSEEFQQDAFLHALTQFRLFVEETTDLGTSVRPIEDFNIWSGGTITFVFVDENNLRPLTEYFSPLPSAVAMIEGVVNPEIPCLGGLFEWSEVSEASIVFINAEHFNEPEDVSSCVREEAFNLLGLIGDPQGDESLFSDQRWRGENWPAPAYFGYGDRDFLLMRLFYRPIFQNGQLIDETRQEIQQIIQSECDL